jgi:hypothetical protein
MRGRILYDPIRLADGSRIHLFKLDRGALESDWEAYQVAAKLSQRLHAPHRFYHVVIMEGEPGENPRLFGPSASVARVRSMLGEIAGHAWAPVHFERRS